MWRKLSNHPIIVWTRDEFLNQSCASLVNSDDVAMIKVLAASWNLTMSWAGMLRTDRVIIVHRIQKTKKYLAKFLKSVFFQSSFSLIVDWFLAALVDLGTVMILINMLWLAKVTQHYPGWFKWGFKKYRYVSWVRHCFINVLPRLQRHPDPFLGYRIQGGPGLKPSEQPSPLEDHLRAELCCNLSDSLDFYREHTYMHTYMYIHVHVHIHAHIALYLLDCNLRPKSHEQGNFLVKNNSEGINYDSNMFIRQATGWKHLLKIQSAPCKVTVDNSNKQAFFRDTICSCAWKSCHVVTQ